jgi:hypothetical protein
MMPELGSSYTSVKSREHLAEGCLREPAVLGLELGHVLGDQIALLQLAVRNRHQPEQAAERLGGRHHLVRLVGIHAVQVFLIDDLVAADHDNGVGPGFLQELGHTLRLARTRLHDLYAVLEIPVYGVAQRHRFVGGRNVRCRIEHPHVLVGPAVERRRLQCVRLGDLFIGRRREAFHDAEFLCRGVFVVGGFGGVGLRRQRYAQQKHGRCRHEGGNC